MKYFLSKAFRIFRGAFFFLCIVQAAAQELPQSKPIESERKTLYDQDRLPKEFHRERREALRNLMGDSSVAIIFSNTLKNRANDVDYEFHQDPDLYYLTGHIEPESMLLLFKDPYKDGEDEITELIYVPERNEKWEKWSGRQMGTKGAIEELGFQKASDSYSFSGATIDFSKFKTVYFIPPTSQNESRLVRKVNMALSGDNSDKRTLKEFMAVLREVKTPEEMILMRKAIELTCVGLAEAIKALEPGMSEFDVEAIAEYVFKSRGAEDVGYPSIVGGGENSCILHYNTNRKMLVGKDMLVVDIGAEYHGYTADVTRTLPVDGKFSDEEKAIYDLVLAAQEAGIAKCKPGEAFRAPHKAAKAVLIDGLKSLGVIKQNSEIENYFFHGTSHYLGLDVHDRGTFGKLKPNSIITVEPGIYIAEGSACDPKWWNIGIRIEDDVLITEGEPEVLSDCIPKTTDAIEKLMKEESLFNLIKK